MKVLKPRGGLMWVGLAILLLIGCTRSFPGSRPGGIGTLAPAAPYPNQRDGPTEPPLPFPTPVPVTPDEAPYPGGFPQSASATTMPTGSPPRPVEPPTPSPPAGELARHVLLLPFIPYSEPRPTIERVLIISIDGLRPEGIIEVATGKVNAPFLYSLSQQGAVDWAAQTVTPSTTLPGHTSMLTGYGVAKHGVDIASYRDLLKRAPYLQVPTIFDYAQEFGLRTVMVAGKKKMNYFHRPDSLDIFQTFTEKSDEDRFDGEIASRGRKIMRDGFGMMFIHFPDTDSAGHLDGWLSKPYLGTVRRVDKSIKSIFTKLTGLGLLETTLVIITADHAGNDVGHMGGGPRETTIPWIIIGPGVLPGTTLTDIQIFDTAATALWAVGIPPPSDLDGRVVREAFQQE